MIYQFCSNETNMLHMTERHSRSQISYYSKHRIKELFPNGDYEVIGEIGNFAKRYPSQDVIVTDMGKSIPIFPRGSFKKPFEWLAGYVAVGENTYVAVIKNIIFL